MLPALQVLSTASKAAVSRHCGLCAPARLSGLVCSEGRQHRWHQNISLHTTAGRHACFRIGGGAGSSVMTWSVLHETHCKLHQSPNKSCCRQNKTQDIRPLNDGGAAAARMSPGRGGGIHWDCPLGGYQPARGQTQGPSHKRLIVGV